MLRPLILPDESESLIYEIDGDNVLTKRIRTKRGTESQYTCPFCIFWAYHRTDIMSHVKAWHRTDGIYYGDRAPSTWTKDGWKKMTLPSRVFIRDDPKPTPVQKKDLIYWGRKS
jgi:hypothetical protein